jgi:hypothetical protein
MNLHRYKKGYEIMRAGLGLFEMLVLNMRREAAMLFLLVAASLCCAFLSVTYGLAFSADSSWEAVLAQRASLPNGLVSLKHDPKKKSLSGAFVYQGTSVHFETRRGPQTPLQLRMADPETPLYEIDVRIFDERGVPFLIQTGGDGLFEADWEAPGKPAGSLDVEQDTVAINKNWHAAKKMIEGLKTVKFRPEFMAEYEAIINLLPGVEDALSPEL